MKLRLTMVGRGQGIPSTLPAELELGASARVGDALRAMARLLPDETSLPASCLIVLNGKHLGTIERHEDAPVAEQDDLVLIAPVAGG